MQDHGYYAIHGQPLSASQEPHNHETPSVSVTFSRPALFGPGI